MRNKDNKHLGIEIDPNTHRKLKSVAESEGRSANKEIEQFLKKRVAEFEKENGEIEL